VLIASYPLHENAFQLLPYPFRPSLSFFFTSIERKKPFSFCPMVDSAKGTITWLCLSYSRWKTWKKYNFFLYKLERLKLCHFGRSRVMSGPRVRNTDSESSKRMLQVERYGLKVCACLISCRILICFKTTLINSTRWVKALICVSAAAASDWIRMMDVRVKDESSGWIIYGMESCMIWVSTEKELVSFHLISDRRCGWD